MLATPPVARPGFRSARIIASSVLVHLGVLAAIIFHRPTVIELAPAWLAYGDSGHTYRVTYFPPGVDASSMDGKLVLPRDATPSRKHPSASETKPVANQEQVPIAADISDHSARAGSLLGTLIDGPITGHEVHVAYPIVFPDPPIVRSLLPPGLNGDVVIEITIDSEGNVVDTLVIQAIGHGIDQTIEATLRQWHYQPATLDGIPVASKHDVHFHFPS